jgi:hypothetical protein
MELVCDLPSWAVGERELEGPARRRAELIVCAVFAFKKKPFELRSNPSTSWIVRSRHTQSIVDHAVRNSTDRSSSSQLCNPEGTMIIRTWSLLMLRVF